MENKKEDYYIFLDFDGVLNDIKTIPAIYKLGGVFVNKKDTKVFSQESIAALNSLLSTLSHRYNPKIVLTTFWRNNMDKATSILYNNGLQFDGEIDSIPFFSYKSRLSLILDYIHEHNTENNFLIIDDIPSITKYILRKNLIKTNIIEGSLNMSQAMNYIDSYCPELTKYFPIEDIFPAIND